MWHLRRQSPSAWAENVDPIAYAQRQAQSCSYLETLFVSIVSRTFMFEDALTDLFAYLMNIHRRQYRDLSHCIDVQFVAGRRSFYFESLYEAFHLPLPNLPEHLGQKALLTILAIQGISYLRGQSRYVLLREHQTATNAPFLPIWRAFYDDATANAAHVSDFIQANFVADQAASVIDEVLVAEDALIQKIWEHNGVCEDKVTR